MSGKRSAHHTEEIKANSNALLEAWQRGLLHQFRKLAWGSTTGGSIPPLPLSLTHHHITWYDLTITK
jgi:hypothetical protein